MDDLLTDFVAETRDMLEALGGEIVAWEADPADRARLDAIFRFVHTVKGNCGFFDFPRLEQLSHAAESALAEVRAGRRHPSSRLVTAVLAILDRISRMIDAIEAGETFTENGDEVLIAALEPDSDDAIEPGDAGDGPANAARPAASGSAPRSIRLPVDLLDKVMSGVSDIVLARNDLARRMREYDAGPVLEGPFERLSSILDELRESVTRMRMQRIESLFGALPRLVRDLSAELGKQVMIDVEGGDVELDREMIEMIRDPLTHIIRNAIDHGIEPPAERLAAGKREIGLLHISARQSGNRISIAIADDGRGLDTDRLVEKAIAAGLLSEQDAERLGPEERARLIFEPGLSTAAEVNAISGRGVGMDVVRANVERIGGSIEIETREGEGVQILLRLPLTLSIISTLTIESAGQCFAIPRSYIEEIINGRAVGTTITRAGDAYLVGSRGRRIPCLLLTEILGQESSEPQGKPLVLVRPAGGRVFALAVDRVLDNEDMVVKPIAPHIMATGLYAGSMLRDDGRPILLLDVTSIADRHGLAGSRARATEEAENPPFHGEDLQESGAPLLLFAAQDGKRRAIRLELVRRIETVAPEAISMEGETAHCALEGRIYPLAGLESGDPPDRPIQALRLYDGASEVLLATERVIDRITLRAANASAADSDSPAMTIHEGSPVPLVDAMALFAQHRARGAKTRPTCRLPAEDEWSRTILKPLVEAAGCRVLAPDDEEEADLGFYFDDDGEVLGARKAVRITDEQSGAGDAPDCIYRYDREALLALLRGDRGEAA